MALSVGALFLALSLAGSCGAFSLRSPRAVTHGCGTNAMRNQVPPQLNARNDFCFGHDQTVIGFKGGMGKGMADHEPTPTATTMLMGSPRDDFCFGRGNGMRSTVVGFQGGAGKGMGVSDSAARQEEGGAGKGMGVFDSARQNIKLGLHKADPVDEFRFGYGTHMRSTVVGFQGGGGKGMGVFESARTMAGDQSYTNVEPAGELAEEVEEPAEVAAAEASAA